MRITAHNFRQWQAPPQSLFIVLYLRTPEQQPSPYYQHLISYPFEVPSVLRVVASFHHYFRCTSPLTCPAVVRRSLIVSQLPCESVTLAVRCFSLGIASPPQLLSLLFCCHHVKELDAKVRRKNGIKKCF